MTTGKTIALTTQICISKMMFLLFIMLSRFVIAFLPRSKCLLISQLQLLSAVILEPEKIKSATIFHCFPVYWHEVMGPDAMILVFWMLSFKPASSLSSFTFIKRHFNSSSLSAIRVVSFACLRLLLFLCPILIAPCASSSPVYLTYMLLCPWEMGEMSITSDTQMTPAYGRKQRRTKEPLDESERGVKKLAYNSTLKKLR